LLESEIKKKNNIQLQKRTDQLRSISQTRNPGLVGYQEKKRTESTQNNPIESKLKKLQILISQQINIE